MIHNAGIGLFAAHELPIDYYCSILIWRSSLKLSFDEHVEIELPDELTDGFSILMQGSTREWVAVSRGGCGELSLCMVFQFMNDIGLSFHDQAEN